VRSARALWHRVLVVVQAHLHRAVARAPAQRLTPRTTWRARVRRLHPVHPAAQRSEREKEWVGGGEGRAIYGRQGGFAGFGSASLACSTRRSHFRGLVTKAVSSKRKRRPWVDAPSMRMPPRPSCFLCTSYVSLNSVSSCADSFARVCARTSPDRILSKRVWKAATSKAEPRKTQDWVLKCLQGGRAHPLAACGMATLYCSPPAAGNRHSRRREA
jgi:hypothetical protein